MPRFPAKKAIPFNYSGENIFSMPGEDVFHHLQEKSYESLSDPDLANFLLHAIGENQDRVKLMMNHAILTSGVSSEEVLFKVIIEGEFVTPLQDLYDWYSNNAEEGNKKKLIISIGKAIQDQKPHFLPEMLMLPIFRDINVAVISTAVMEYAQNAFNLKGEELFSVKFLIDLIEGKKNSTHLESDFSELTKRLVNPFGIFAGLMILGDPRLNDFLKPLCHRWTDLQLEQLPLSQCTHVPTVLFIIEWLIEEATKGNAKKVEVLGNKLDKLMCLGKKMGLVFVVKRNFPIENPANLVAAQEIIPFPEMLKDQIFLGIIEKIRNHPFIRSENIKVKLDW